MFRTMGIPELVVLLLLLVAYFLPSVIAVARKKTQVTPILLIDLLLGWTVIGWIGALIWALLPERVDPANRMPPAQTTAGPRSPHRFCSRCGKPNEMESPFCPNCGSAFA